MEHPALAFAAGYFHALKHLAVYFLTPLLWEADDKGHKLGEPEPDHAGASSCPEQITYTIWGHLPSLILQKTGPLELTCWPEEPKLLKTGENAASTVMISLTFALPRGSSKMNGAHQSRSHRNHTFTFEQENARASVAALSQACTPPSSASQRRQTCVFRKGVTVKPRNSNARSSSGFQWCSGNIKACSCILCPPGQWSKWRVCGLMYHACTYLNP